jgi:hypothetical protein
MPELSAQYLPSMLEHEGTGFEAPSVPERDSFIQLTPEPASDCEEDLSQDEIFGVRNLVVEIEAMLHQCVQQVHVFRYYN